MSSLCTSHDPLSYIKVAARLAKMAGWSHDFGKLSEPFQAKLENSQKSDAVLSKDPVRHEWLSGLMLKHLIKQGDFSPQTLESGLTRLGELRGKAREKEVTTPPVAGKITNLYEALQYCVVSHHRVFSTPRSPEASQAPKTHGTYNHVETHNQDTQYRLPAGKSISAAFQDSSLLSDLQATYAELEEQCADKGPEFWRMVTLVARAGLILADHQVSAQIMNHPHAAFYANTHRDEKKTSRLNQDLVWHLGQVGNTAGDYTQLFTGEGFSGLRQESRECILARSDSPRYAWQDQGSDFVSGLPAGPKLILNIAGTGSGKTRGNLKLLAAAKEEGAPLRVTSAFNLRTLTLQTRDAYRGELELSDDELGCIIGDELAVNLHDLDWADSDNEGWEPPKKPDSTDIPEVSGEVNYTVDWPGRVPEGVQALIKNESSAKLLAAPILVCTVDQIIAAGNIGDHSRHPRALLRVATSDLVLDELDSYDTKGLVAVLRLIHISAMFGRNIVISSATLPPVLVNAVLKVWEDGQRIRAKTTEQPITDWVVAVADRRAPAVLSVSGESAEMDYDHFCRSNAKHGTTVTKRYRIVDVRSESEFLPQIYTSCVQLAQDNATEYDGKRISIGLVRVARIQQCIEVARYLFDANPPPDTEIIVTAYHSREVLARRSLKEKNLDKILNRKGDSRWWERTKETREQVQGSSKRNIIFIVVATPVEEVGRDHDFDWGVIEPSSLASILQTGGRINRHRLLEVFTPNIVLLNRSYAHLTPDNRDNAGPYIAPGHRSKTARTHLTETGDVACLRELLDADQGILTTEMIFSQTPCRFANEDAKGIECVLTPGLEAILDARSWLNDWLYINYPLREGFNQCYYYRDESILGDITVSGICELVNPYIKNQKYTRVHAVTEEPPPNTGVFFSGSILGAIETLEQRNGDRQPLSREELCAFPYNSKDANKPRFTPDWTGIRKR